MTRGDGSEEREAVVGKCLCLCCTAEGVAINDQVTFVYERCGNERAIVLWARFSTRGKPSVEE